MNVIFLDVDGVLNSINELMRIYEKTHKSYSGFDFPFDENCLKNLKYLVENTNSKIVISSTWRKSKNGIKILLEKLKEYDLDKEVIGYTPVLNNNREKEIKEFILRFNQDINFIILDDISNLGDLNNYLITINSQCGLTQENVEEGMKKLKRLL